MNIARLGAAGAAAAVVALCAAGPAFATNETPAPGAGGGVEKGKPSAPTDKLPGGQQPTASVSPTSFFAGDTLTFTVEHCRIHPKIVDVNNLFVSTTPFAPAGLGKWSAKEVTRKNLVEGKEYKVVVSCGRWTDTFTTKPHKRPKPTPTPSSPSTAEPTGVPSGAPQTGDGSSNGGNMGLIAGGAGVVVIGLAGGTFLYTRRRSSAGA